MYISSDEAVPSEPNYYYMQRGGQGVDVYVLDTGLDPKVADLMDHRFFTTDSYVIEEPTSVVSFDAPKLRQIDTDY